MPRSTPPGKAHTARSNACWVGLNRSYDHRIVSPQGPLPALVPVRARGQIEGSTQPVADGGQGQHGHLSGDQLDGQRQTVEVLQDLHQRFGVRSGQLVVTVVASRVLEERPHARLPLQGGQVVDDARRRQRLEAQDVLAAGVQRQP